MDHVYTTVKRFAFFTFIVLNFILAIPAFAQPKISFQSVINSTTPTGGAVTNPIDIVNAGDGTNRLFVVQQNGVIKAYTQSPVAYLGDFLTVSGMSTGGERGLLSMAFHPNYKSNGYFFVYYTNTNGDIEIARYHTPAATPNAADVSSKQILLTIPHPGQSNHNGGKLNFGADGYLYFATGDGGGGGDVPNNAQTGSVLLGKMLRIDVSVADVAPFYTIPPDNPFLAVGDNIRDEIWSFGLRNPFRWSFDRLTHDMWIGDVGQNLYEEINFSAANNTKGLNYGWHCKEGTHDYNGGCTITNGVYAAPVLDYPHNNATGGFAVIGGYVYRGTQSPSMYGYYIFADEVSSNVWLLPPGGTAADTIQFSGALSSISAFGESEDGELYAASLSGQIYHVLSTTDAALPVKLLGFSGLANTGYNDLNWQTVDEIQFKQFEIEYSEDGLAFNQAGIVKAAGTSNYHFTHSIAANKKLYYRLKMVDADDRFEYSNTIILASQRTAGQNNFVTPSIIINGQLTVDINDAYTALQMINMDGRVVYNEVMTNRTGRVTMPITTVPSGQYLVRLSGSNKQVMQRVVVQQ
ncbi:MAG: PQQ-dependent sugar dehydrogenase [Chitinophagaceae bacterium]